MKYSLRLVVLFGGASLVAGASLLVACSDDTTVNPTTDGGHPDGPTPTEGGPDSGTDTGTDTSPPFDGGFVVDTFDGVLAAEICKALARCCYGNPNPPDGGADGGSFDAQKCRDNLGRVGFESSNADSPLKDGGNITLDQVSADSCIKKVQAMSCNLPGAEFKAIRTACFGAYAGKLAAGATCIHSIECQPGSFCKTVGDAGTGQCLALRGLNGACGDSDPERPDEACSYRAGGNTGNFCKFGDVVTGVILPPAAWKCEAAGPAGFDCATNVWCNETICNDNSKCETPNKYFDSQCGLFIK